jgi:hypothetical protein
MSKLRFASDLEKRAVEWARRTYGNAWKAKCRQTVSEQVREIRQRNLSAGMYGAKHPEIWAARPYGYREMNVLKMAARLCLRRNERFPSIAKKMAAS